MEEKLGVYPDQIELRQTTRNGMVFCPSCLLPFQKLVFRGPRKHNCYFDDEPHPLCKCGCGEQIVSKPNGIWSQYRPGHNMRGIL